MHTRFDQTGKQILRAVLEDDGTFTAEFEVSPDPQHADGYFVPHEHRTSQVVPTLLGRISETPCSFELFSASPDEDDVAECVRKHLNLRHIVHLGRGREQAPYQWIITAGKPKQAFGAYAVRRAKTWPQGVYHAASGLATSFVVVRELPRNRSTLLLRLMGRGPTFRNAVEDLKALSIEDFERCIVLPILVRFRIEAAAAPASPIDEEFVMNSQEILDMMLQQAEQRGQQRGELSGELRGELRGQLHVLERQRNLVVRLFQRKFGEVPTNAFAHIKAADVDALEQITDKLMFAKSMSDVFAL